MSSNEQASLNAENSEKKKLDNQIEKKIDENLTQPGNSNVISKNEINKSTELIYSEDQSQLTDYQKKA